MAGEVTPTEGKDSAPSVMTDTVTLTTSALAVRLEQLWSEERCDWRIEFERSSYGRIEESIWTLTLEWTQEGGSPHRADWTTYHWQFYALISEGGPEDVLLQAVEWCEALLPFAECDACGGDGTYGKGGEVVTCEECDGTGLANR